MCLRLQLAELLQRTFRKHRKIPRILGEDGIAVRFEDALHPAHLLEGLIKLLGRLDRNVILNIPFFLPGCCRTCWKNAVACSTSSVPRFATTTQAGPTDKRTVSRGTPRIHRLDAEEVARIMGGDCKLVAEGGSLDETIFQRQQTALPLGRGVESAPFDCD